MPRLHHGMQKFENATGKWISKSVKEGWLLIAQGGEVFSPNYSLQIAKKFRKNISDGFRLLGFTRGERYQLEPDEKGYYYADPDSKDPNLNLWSFKRWPLNGAL